MVSKKSLELLQREQAFRLYRKFRDLKKVANYPGMPDIEILKIWKEEDDWDGRIEEIEGKLEVWNSLLKKLEEDSILRDDVFYLMLLNKLLEVTIRAIVEKGLEPASWKEAIETIKLIYDQKRLLLGRPQLKAEIDLTGMSEEELRKYLKEFHQLLASRTQTVQSITEEIIPQLENKDEKELDKTLTSNFLADIKD